MNLHAYLSRIGYTDERHPAAGVLFAIQRAHLLAVPFENLDIHLGRPIALEEAALYEKIVGQRRGGFCYELNGLLAWALTEMGFNVQRLSAQSANDDGSYSAEFDHLLLGVTCPAEPGGGPAWLVDVGWGNGPRYPLRIGEQTEQRQEDEAGPRTFRLRGEEGAWVLEERGGRGLEGEGQASLADWVRHYRFGLRARKLADFAGMCRYHQTSPESSFTRQRLVTRFTPRGRLTLAGLRLITIERGQRSERLLADEDEVRQVLKESFGIDTCNAP